MGDLLSAGGTVGDNQAVCVRRPNGRQQVELASQRKKLTVFFSDIAGFTETTDKMESEDLTRLLVETCGTDIAVTILDAATPTKAVVASGPACH